MIIYWSIVLIILIINGATYIKEKEISEKIKDLSMVLLMVAISFLIVGILGKDPIFESIGLPKEYEWVGGLLSSWFLAWWTYLRPLKERVVKLEIRLGRIEERLNSIEDKIRSIDKNIEWIRTNCQIKPQ